MKKITLLLCIFISWTGFSQNLVTNGDFSGGAASWASNHSNPPEIRTEGGNSFFFANVATAVSDSFLVNLQQNITLEANKFYLVSFTAQSDTDGRLVRTGIGLNEGNFANDNRDIPVSTSLQTYTQVLQAPSTITATNGRVFFDLAHSAGTISIDDVSVIETVAPSLPEPTNAPNIPPARAEGNVISLYGDAYDTALGLNNVSWDEGSDSNEVSITSNNLLKVNFVNFLGTNIGSKVDLTGSEMTHFHFDVWIADDWKAGQVFNVKLSNHKGGAGETDAFELTRPINENEVNTWVSIDVPIANLAQVRDDEELDDRASDLRDIVQLLFVTSGTIKTAYLDNIYFYKEENNGGVGNSGSEYCETVIFNAGDANQADSAAKLTIENTGDNTMKITVESNTTDPVDELVLPFPITGSPGVSAKDESVVGKISITLTWNSAPPATVDFNNILWSKTQAPGDGGAGNWALGAITGVPFGATCSTASVNDVNAIGFSMYPNPAKNNITITAKETITKAEVFNILGSRVKSFAINSLTKTLDINDLKSGIYMLRFTSNGKVGTAKFIKE